MFKKAVNKRHPNTARWLQAWN